MKKVKTLILALLIFSCVLSDNSLLRLRSLVAFAETASPTPIDASIVLTRPRNLKVKAANGNLIVNWTAVRGAEQYRVYRASSPKSPPKLMATVTTTEFEDKDTIPGTAYYYTVEATAQSIVSALSQQAKGAVPTPRPTPRLQAPGNVKVVRKGGVVVVSWNEVKGAKTYRVFRATSAKGKYTAVATVNVNEYKDRNVSEGVTYYYKVEAQNAGNLSKHSPVKKIIVPTPTPIPYTRFRYKDVARNPAIYDGEYAKFTNCRVVQQIDIDDSSDIEAIVTSGGHNNVLYLIIPGFKDWEWTGAFEHTGVARLLEGDRIDITGKLLGSYTYTTINDTTLTVPLFEVDYMTLYD